MEKRIYHLLSQSPVFKGLTPVEIAELVNKVKYRLKKYLKGQTVALRGDRCEELIIVLEGSIRGEMLDLSGKLVEVETIPAPQPIAAAFIFGHKNEFPVDAVANEDVVLLSIPRNSLVQLMQLSPQVLTNYLDAVSSRAHFLSEKLWFMSFKTIKEKLAQYILSVAREKDQLVLPRNQEELSEYFGVTRPSLSRVMAELERENIIEYDRQKVTIKNRQRLIRLLES